MLAARGDFSLQSFKDIQFKSNQRWERCAGHENGSISSPLWSHQHKIPFPQWDPMGPDVYLCMLTDVTLVNEDTESTMLIANC